MTIAVKHCRKRVNRMRLTDLDRMDFEFKVEDADLSKLAELLADVNIKETPWFDISDKHGNSARYYREDQWIPCSERLPEVHETGNSFSGVYMQSYPVLVYGVPEGEEECGFHVVTYCDDLNGYTYWSTELDTVTIDEVKAWMPLPPAYKGGE